MILEERYKKGGLLRNDDVRYSSIVLDDVSYNQRREYESALDEISKVTQIVPQFEHKFSEKIQKVLKLVNTENEVNSDQKKELLSKCAQAYDARINYLLALPSTEQTITTTTMIADYSNRAKECRDGLNDMAEKSLMAKMIEQNQAILEQNEKILATMREFLARTANNQGTNN